MSVHPVISFEDPTPIPSGDSLTMRLPHSSETESFRDAALLRSVISSFGHPPTSRLPADLFETSDYTIGLIPVDKFGSKSGSATSRRSGVNSIVVLPLTWKELLVRLRAEVSQAESRRTDECIRFGTATVNFSTMEATRSGIPIDLTALQFKLIHYFAKNPRRVISREELLNKVWGYNNYPSTRTVDTTVVRLRRSFEPEPAKPIHFQTIFGAGYKFIP